MQGYRKYVPSVADTMSVWSGPSVKGSIYGDGAQDQYKAKPPVFKPPVPKPPVPRQQPAAQKVLMQDNPYVQLQKPAEKQPQQVMKRRPQSVRGGSGKPGSKQMAKATGQLAICPGLGPFVPQGAAKNVARPMYRGKPKPTGVFDAQTKFPPTNFAVLYHQGDIPCRVDLKGDPDQPGPQVRTILWTNPGGVKKLDLDRYLPIFVEGLREKGEPTTMLANQGLHAIIDSLPVKQLLKQLRGIIYPLKDGLRTLDDEVCLRVLKTIEKIARRSDALAEAFVAYFPVLLPIIEILRNKHAKFGRVVARPKSVRADPKKFVKLVDLKRSLDKPDLGALIQNILEYFERHGGLHALVTIKKMIPHYESVMFS